MRFFLNIRNRKHIIKEKKVMIVYEEKEKYTAEDGRACVSEERDKTKGTKSSKVYE